MRGLGPDGLAFLDRQPARDPNMAHVFTSGNVDQMFDRIATSREFGIIEADRAQVRGFSWRDRADIRFEAERLRPIQCGRAQRLTRRH